MPWRTIFRYSLSAGCFGLVAAAIWLMARCARQKRGPGRQDVPGLLTAFYLAALIQIIGLRLGLHAVRWLGGVPHLRPLQVTLHQWRRGPGAFVYHVVGNLLWFMPLGAVIARRRPASRWYHGLLAGMGLSLTVELMQLLLGTGMPDVDDVLLNSLGALTGWGSAKALERRRRRVKP